MEGINARLNEQGGSGGGGGGGGEAAKLAVSITYSELLALINGGQLTPGTWYRITDYQCTTTQDGTQSAGHAFDIIVRADDASRLNENAFAAHHEGDTYFQDCDLEAWVLKYCVTNDTNRFAWADAENGKGVVFYMKDEWNNECGYDFKNILFANSGVSPSPDPGPEPDPGPKGATRDSEVGYCYTFTWVTEDGVIQDATIVCQTMDNGEGMYMGVTGNVIKECYMPVAYEGGGGGGDDPGTEEMSSINTRGAKGVSMMKGSKSLAKNRDGESGSLKLYLPFNMFINTFEDAGGEYCFGCVSNEIGANSFMIKFGTWCSMMSFGNGNNSMSFGNENSGLSFGNNNGDMSFGNENYDMTFGNNNRSLSFGNYNMNLSFGNGNFGLSFGNNNGGLSFGNFNSNLSFGNGCGMMSFGNDNYDMTFGNYNESMTFGNRCGMMTFGNNIRYVTVFDGACDCDVTGTDSGYVQYAQILNSVGSNGHVTINFAKDQLYTQVAGLDNNGSLVIWNPAGNSSPS